VKNIDLYVGRTPDKHRKKGETGLWLSPEILKTMPLPQVSSIWWWLPPAIFPEDEKIWEEAIEMLIKKGATQFVLNAPWQIAFFPNPKNMRLWSGPFCNIANGLAIKMLASLGFSGAMVSPELGREDYLSLAKNSSLPLGIVIFGDYPLCVSRTISENLTLCAPFSSPKREEAYVVNRDGNYWVYPNWRLDLLAHKDELARAGYRVFTYLNEPLPDQIALKDRPGLWNWNHQLV
jgi:putative protease